MATARRLGGLACALVLGAGIGLVPTTTRAAESLCFGGGPEVVVREQPEASDLRVQGRTLLWSSQGRIRSFDLDKGAATTLGQGDQIRAADDRYVALTSARNQLSLVDRRTRAQRLLVDGHRAYEIALASSSVALVDRYVYFGFTAPNYRREREAGFFRVPIDGSRRAERLAMEPDGETPFLVARDRVVWVDGAPGAFVIHERPVGSSGPARAERRPFPAGRTIKGVPSVEAVQLVGDEIFFLADHALWSVALDRQEPVRERIPAAWPSVQSAPSFIVQGPCAYFADHVLRRARLDSGAGSETLVAAEQLGDGSLASDGRYLYWASRGGQILRSGPSAAAHVVRPPLVAKPASAQPNRGADAYELLLGDDLGCVQLLQEGRRPDRAWRCWRSSAASLLAPAGREASGLARIPSLAMPGLAGLQLVAGSGRLCTKGVDRPRCAPGGQVLDTGGQVLRTADAVTGTQVFVGGTFDCTLAADGLRCAGDDTYGQRASDAMAEPARSTPGGWRATWSALGAWHGCATSEDGRTACWGRNDLGQLGHASLDVCRTDGATLACTRSPRQTAAPIRAALLAADQFTCAVGQGLWCWGGSRDGVFGTADGCAPSVRQAWPTRTGPVVAPHPTCARAPVRVAGFSDREAGRPSHAWQSATRGGKPHQGPAYHSFSVGPRGICGIAYGKVRCRGAVPTPVIPAGGPELFEAVAVNPGERPAACASNRRQVICWGAGYSPEAEPGRPVEIDFDAGTSSGAPVVDAPAPVDQGWPKACLVHRACAATPPGLPACAARADAPPWTELRPRAASLVGTRIGVRGALGVGRLWRDAHHRACGEATSGREIVVGASDLDDEGLLVLGGQSCSGDDSRLCCTVPAYGQQVRVEGKLVPTGDGNYVLQSPQICQDPTTP